MARGAGDQVDDYLRRLSRQLYRLPREDREEIVSGVRDHIAARLEAPGAGPEQVPDVLRQVGDPAAVARDALQRFGIPEPCMGPREFATVAILGVGSVFLPVISSCVAAYIGKGSTRWTSDEKWRAFAPAVVLSLALLVIGIVGTAIVHVAVSSNGASAAPWWVHVLPLFLIAALIGVPVWAAVWLTRRLRAITRTTAYLFAFAALFLMSPAAFVQEDVTGGAFTQSSAQGCGAAYQTDHYGPAATIRLDVGYCRTGSKVHSEWGPDCTITSLPMLVARVTKCVVTEQTEVGLTVQAEYSVAGLLPLTGSSTSTSVLMVLPDGRAFDASVPGPGSGVVVVEPSSPPPSPSPTPHH